MDKLDMLKTLVNERLSIAAEEIYGMGARIVWEVEHQYKADLSRLKKENERQRKLLDAMLKPDVLIQRSELPEEVLYQKKKKKGGHCHVQEAFQPPEKEIRRENPEEADGLECKGEENTPVLQLNVYSDGEDGQIPGLDGEHSEMLKLDGDDGENPKQMDDADNGHLTMPTASSKTTEKLGNSLKRKNTGMSSGEQKLPLNVLKRALMSREEPSKGTDMPMKVKRSRGRKLRRPRKKRSESSALVCKVCNNSFETKKNLISHVKEHSNDCGLCGQHLETTVSLKVHLQSHRTCEVCGKRFTKFITLAKHMKIHTGGKALTCTICCKTFRKENLLQSHSRIHKTEKPYTCTVCEKSFRHSTSLDKHSTIHTGERPFSCLICNKTFRQKTHLSKHVTTHTGDKPYKCNKCNESFRLKGTLKNHMFRHEEHKAFPCSICGKRLARLDSMMRHMKLHEREPVETLASEPVEALASAPVDALASAPVDALASVPDRKSIVGLD